MLWIAAIAIAAVAIGKRIPGVSGVL